MTGDDVHPAARLGFTEAADHYARARPDYPPEIVAWLREQVGLRPGMQAIELGAGTGKFTRSLLQTGAEILAVEPLAAMRAHLLSDLTGVVAKEGSAEAIPASDAAADAVVCAQSFHWFATPRALAEIARVLKPRGILAMVWNAPDDRVPWVAAIADILAAYDADCPQQFRHGNWRKVFPDPHFSGMTVYVYPHFHTGSARQVIIERAQSLSYIASLPQREQEAVASRLEAVIASTPELRGRALIEFPYRTSAYYCRKQ